MKLPVVLIPTGKEKQGRAGVDQRRGAQAKALGAAAARAGIGTVGFKRDEDGAPLAREDGWCWSVANTRKGVVATVAPGPVGVDLESMDRPRVAPVEEFADEEERAHVADWDTEATLRLWTAKEAVLKKAGCGIAELRECRLAAPPTIDGMVLDHRDAKHKVRHFVAGKLIVAIVSDAPGEPELLTLSEGRK